MTSNFATLRPIAAGNWDCSKCGRVFESECAGNRHIREHNQLTPDTDGETTSPRQCYFTVTGSARQVHTYLDDNGQPIALARGWYGHSLDEIMSEAARRVRLWEESTGQSAYRIEVTCLKEKSK